MYGRRNGKLRKREEGKRGNVRERVREIGLERQNRRDRVREREDEERAIEERGTEKKGKDGDFCFVFAICRSFFLSFCRKNFSISS